MNDFRKLRVWHRSHELALAVYRAASTFPSHERFGLAEQVRRAAISIPANIAEGCGRPFQRDEAHLRQVAFASACELEAELLLARDLGYVTSEDHECLSGLPVEVKRMLGKLTQRAYAQPRRPAPDPAALS